MKRILKGALGFTILLLLNFVCNAQTTTLVSIDANGKLTYTADSYGNIIPDFSMVGYHSGEKELPNVPVKVTLYPGSGDRRADIQNAIDSVAAMAPDANGHRGAILLTTGYYAVSDTLHIITSGIVIRGEGKDANGTIIELTATNKTILFKLSGSEDASADLSTEKQVVGTFPIGTKTITVESGHSFQAGDRVYLTSGLTATYIDSLGTDELTTICGPGYYNWTAPYNTEYKRIVDSVNGNDITLDAPVVDPIHPDYCTATLAKYTWAGKIEECGIENIQLKSSYTSDTDEDHGWIAIEISHIENAWIKDVDAYYFGYANVLLNDGGYKVTVQDCGMFDYKSIITGGRRYGFAINKSDLCLIMNCETTEGRHDFVTGAKSPGPNVFYNGTATNAKSDCGPHHRWATGILFDNITTDNDLNAQNRNCSGTGHGWAGANMVNWNCSFDNMVLHNPPANPTNWAIGCTGNITNVGYYATEPLGVVESKNNPITAIPSLYLAQLTDRFAPTAPNNLNATVNSSQVNLSWTDNSNNEDGFVIERSENGGSWSELATVGANTTSYSDTDVTSEYINIYRIRSKLGTATSVSSNEEYATDITYITTIADSYIRGGTYADDNYGNSIFLATKENSSDSYKRQAFVKFDVSGLSPNITAKLRLTTGNSNVNTFEAFLVSDDSWTESGITWNNAPSAGVSLGTLSNSASNVLEWDITSEVLTEMLGDDVISIKIVGTVYNVYSSVQSKEKTTFDLNKPSIVYKTIPLAPYEEIIAGDDAYVRAGSYADNNYGTGNLALKYLTNGPNSYSREAIIKFDVSGIDGYIEDATLKLTVQDNDLNGFNAYFISNDNWSESSVTWNNKPAYSAQIGSTIYNSTSNRVLQWDVTDLVKTENSGDGDISFYIKVTDNQTFNWLYSKDASTPAYQPAIVINNPLKNAYLASTRPPEKRDNNLLIYPNPVNDKLYFKNLPEDATIQIVNSLGQTMAVKKHVHFMDVSGLKPGFYILLIDNKVEIKSVKFLKK